MHRKTSTEPAISLGPAPYSKQFTYIIAEQLCRPRNKSSLKGDKDISVIIAN